MKKRTETVQKNRSCQSCAYFRGKHAGMSSCRHYEVTDGRVAEATYERPYGVCHRYHEAANISIKHIELEDIRIS